MPDFFPDVDRLLPKIRWQGRGAKKKHGNGSLVQTVGDVSMWEQLSLAAFMQRYWADNQVHAVPFLTERGVARLVFM